MEDNIYELVYMSRMGDPAALALLMEQFHDQTVRHIKKFCEEYDQMNLEMEDLLQESRISLYTAVRTYRYGMNTSFRTYAYTLLDNRLKSILRNMRTNKAKSNLNTMSLNGIYCYSETLHECVDLIEQKDSLANPEYVLVMHEAYEVLCDTINEMSEKQREAVFRWVNDQCVRPYRKGGTKEERNSAVMINHTKKKIREVLGVKK